MSEQFKNTEEYIDLLKEQIANQNVIINLLIKVLMIERNINESMDIETILKGNLKSVN